MNEAVIKTAIVEGIKFVVTSESLGRFICGTYSDGTTRSLADSISGEFLSPKDKAKKLKKKNKKKKKKNK